MTEVMAKDVQIHVLLNKTTPPSQLLPTCMPKVD